jgi:hypothetical protein
MEKWEQHGQLQTDRLLLWLKDHPDGINPLVAWKFLGIYRLAAIVHKLRKAGHEITTDRQPVFNRFGEECSVAHYRLVLPEQPQEATKPPPQTIGLAEPVKAPRRFLGDPEEPAAAEPDPNQIGFKFGPTRVQ